MLYILFLVLAVLYNIRKFRKERDAVLNSIMEAKHSSHREMILGHYFYIFVFEGFLSFIVAHLITERARSIGIVELAIVYLTLLFAGFFFFQFFIRYIERHTNLELYQSFKVHLVKEMRVNFSLIFLPIVLYNIINWAFIDGIYQEWGRWWFVGLIFNIILVSVLTIVCSVVLMLRLIPNREITEPEYLEIINKRLAQINQPHIRVRWIETDIKNAFVVGLKLLRFSNQTMFIGKSLRDHLTLEEFDAIVCHELGHVANRHIQKRVIAILKNFLLTFFGCGALVFTNVLITYFWGDEIYLYGGDRWWSYCLFGLILSSYYLLFHTFRLQEFEADGYAVMVLGADLNAFKSGLEKLINREWMPAHLNKPVKKEKRNPYLESVLKIFCTHPDFSERISYLQFKMQNGLPYNYYVSKFQKVMQWLGRILDWKVSVPLTATLIVSFVWLYNNIKHGTETVNFITHSDSEKIMARDDLVPMINSRPGLASQTLMYYVVKKKDEKLIDHFISRGADKGKTLLYLAQTRNYELFLKYYSQYQDHLTDDEYFLILRKTATVNFTEGYRLLVNAKQFETLQPKYKENIVQIHESHTRAPASVKEVKE